MQISGLDLIAYREQLNRKARSLAVTIQWHGLALDDFRQGVVITSIVIV